MSNRYSAEYLNRALKSDAPLEKPDKAQSGPYYDVLLGLHDAHAQGGCKAATQSWATAKRLRPEVIAIEHRKIIHADELKHLSMPMYLLTYYPIYMGGFNVLVGPSGGGKSFVSLDIAGRIATSAEVVYIAGEGLHGYAARWEAWKDFNKVKTAQLHFYTEALQVMDQQELNAFIDMIREHKPALVIIDTLARSAVGVEENSAKEIGQFVGACDTLRTALNCAVLVVHHTGKSGQIRGSSALYAAADSVMALVNEDGRIVLRNDSDAGGKNKHAESAPPKYLKIIPHSVGQFQGAVLLEIDSTVQVETDKLTTNQRLILEALDGYDSGLTAKSIVEATNITQSTVYRSLKQLMKLDYVRFESDKYTITTEGENVL